MRYGITGPVLRGSGIGWDLRKAQPYSSYEDFEFDIPIGTQAIPSTATWFASRRCGSRSASSVRRWKDLPEGPIIAKVPKVIKPPVGEVYVSIEAPKGELGYFLVSDGSRAALSRAGAPAIVHQPAGAGKDGQREAWWPTWWQS